MKLFSRSDDNIKVIKHRMATGTMTLIVKLYPLELHLEESIHTSQTIDQQSDNANIKTAHLP